jgi:hypothetical protein
MNGAEISATTNPPPTSSQPTLHLSTSFSRRIRTSLVSTLAMLLFPNTAAGIGMRGQEGVKKIGKKKINT